MAKNSMTDLMNIIKGMSDKEQSNLVENILKMMQNNKENEIYERENSSNSSCNNMVREHLGDKPDCPHCHARAELGLVVKRGFRKNVQRFYCKGCGKTFVATTNTAFEKSRKDAETWKKFIRLTISGASLKTCAIECEIAYQTAFTWRHKILNAFKVNQVTTKMSGEIQIDEMFLPISYKGNHFKGKFHAMYDSYIREASLLPRKSLRRGSDNKSQSAKDKACVFCMVENGKGFYAAVPGVGFMTNNMLDYTIGQHVNKEKSLIVADQYKVTAKYLEKNNYNHMILSANTSDNPRDHKPEVRDGHHMQHVNAMHRYIRKFLAQYNGVSSKYLENYISLFVWLKNIAANKNDKKKQQVSVARTSTADCYITRRALESYPSIPMCA